MLSFQVNRNLYSIEKKYIGNELSKPTQQWHLKENIPENWIFSVLAMFLQIKRV